MGDYIERKVALRAVNGFFHDPKVDIALNAVPAAPVREDVEGAWVFDSDWWDFVCTNCRGRIGNERTYRFCPHCGARMIGVE